MVVRFLIDLIGFWSSGIVTYAHTEDEGIYFGPDGTGLSLGQIYSLPPLIPLLGQWTKDCSP
jgi:hypothetical protein